MWSSLKSCGFSMVPAILLLAVSSVAASWQLVWIKRWTDAASVKGDPGDPAWIWGLALLSVGTVLSRAAGNVLVALGANRLSRLLHRDMLDRVLHSPVAFFDSTPRGRILNRFTADASTLDTRLASHSRQAVQNVLLAVARVAAIGTERLAVLGISAAVAAVFAFGMPEVEPLSFPPGEEELLGLQQVSQTAVHLFHWEVGTNLFGGSFDVVSNLYSPLFEVCVLQHALSLLLDLEVRGQDIMVATKIYPEVRPLDRCNAPDKGCGPPHNPHFGMHWCGSSGLTAHILCRWTLRE
ncbi:ATP-binding cassette sub-family C member 12-like [Dermacentor andersoni]|uniref:ATP-binding cassette sub-family C member 12-like n=1 Tax=Dermacentor andersoni TaxID=34620 RepID=UPI002416B327|nr:ATP-binding cassette sub-family C member 3-like [Dermacentor andersoni]